MGDFRRLILLNAMLQTVCSGRETRAAAQRGRISLLLKSDRASIPSQPT